MLRSLMCGYEIQSKNRVILVGIIHLQLVWSVDNETVSALKTQPLHHAQFFSRYTIISASTFNVVSIMLSDLISTLGRSSQGSQSTTVRVDTQ